MLSPVTEGLGSGFVTFQFLRLAGYLKISLPTVFPSDYSFNILFKRYSGLTNGTPTTTSIYPSDLSVVVFYTNDIGDPTQLYFSQFDSFWDAYMSGTFADSVYLYFLIDDFSRADLLDSSVGFGFELRYSIKYVGFNTASQLLADLSDVDSSLLEQLAFSRGYESGKKYGEGVGYDKGQADYIKDILPQKESLAHSQGYSEGLKAGNGIFSDLIPSVIIAPITSVLAIFDFSVFGFNLRGLFVGLFSILVIAFIIRKIV